MSGPERVRHAHRRADVDAAGAAEKQPLLVQQPVDVSDRVAVLDVHGLIDRRALEVAGDAADADPFRDRAAAGCPERPAAHVFIQTTARRVGEHAANGGAARLEVLRDARERAAGAGGGDEGIDAAVGLSPDLGARGARMSIAVGGVVELVGPDRVRERGGQPLRDLLVLVGIAVGNRGHLVNLGTQHLEQRVLLRGLVVGHDDHAAVAARVAHMRQPDAGVAGRALDDRASRGELSAALGLQHDRARRPVLDRAAGIHELGLAEDVAAGLFTHAPEPDERGVADRADEAAHGAAGVAARDAHAGTPAAAAGAVSAAPVSVAANAATSPRISSAGGWTGCAAVSAVMSPSVPRRIRCPGSVARSMMATGCPGAAPAARSLAMMPGSCATPM